MRSSSPVSALRNTPWLQLHSFQAQNQSISRLMTAIEAHREQIASGKARPSWLLLTSGVKALLALLAALAGTSMAVVLLASTQMAQPFGLGVLAVLAVTGIFFLFGLLSGFVRFQEKAQAIEIARGVAEAAEHGCQVIADDGSIVFANGAFTALFGTSKKSVEELLAADPRAGEAVYRLARSAERLEARTEEIAVRDPRQRAIGNRGIGSGGNRDAAPRMRWLRISVKPFMPSAAVSDRRRMTLWDVTDITKDRAREFDAINGLEQQLAYYDTMPVGLFAVGPDSRITHFNQTLAGWLGLKPDAQRTASWSLNDICPPEAAALVHGVRRSAAAPVERFDVDLVREDGRAIPVRLVCRPGERPERGDPMTVLVFDRSADLGGDSNVRALEERFARLFHAAPFAIATLDKQGTVVSANAAFQRMCRNDAATPSLQAPKLSDLVLAEATAEDRQAVEAGLARVTSGRATAAPFEVTCGPSQQQTRRIYMSPLTVGADPREAAIVYMLDTSELKALELKFAQSQKMEAVGKLAGGIAHDFNNVLTVIIGMSDLLLQSRRPTDPGYTDIMQIKSNANRAAGMVKQLLAFSRKQTLTPEVLTLNDVV